MASKPITISMISDFFKNHSAQLKRGEKSFESGNVQKMLHDLSIDPPLIKGVVAASMKQRKYDVEIIIKNNSIQSMTCTCPRGQDICHHMASFCLYCHYNISTTDTICSWNRPKSTSADDVISIKEMYPAKPYTAVKSAISKEKVDDFREKLRSCHVVGFAWLLRPESTEQFNNLLPEINNIIYSEEFLQADDKISFFVEKCKLSNENILSIEEKTRGQSRNEHWLIARKFRLTASKFGKIIDACNRNRFPPSLFKSLIGAYNLEGVKAIQWGRENELSALNTFKEKTGLKVTQSGLWLHECGYLGASPDGIIDEQSILEIKCPFKYRNFSAPLKDNLKDVNYLIHFSEEGEVVLNKSHLYFHQIQGQLYLTQRKLCYLIIWTPNDSEIFSVPVDEEWKENIDLLQKFYLEEFIEFLLK